MANLGFFALRDDVRERIRALFLIASGFVLRRSRAMTVRTTLFILLLPFAFSIGGELKPAATPKSMITLQTLEEMFTNIRAKTKWNLDGDMLWGYFFTDQDPKKLEPVAKHLAESGYHVVAIYPAEDKSTYWLHVERVEHHTPKTLDARNQEFYALADKFGITTYDGMDVGPATPKPK